jgi:hypothetical protein
MRAKSPLDLRLRERGLVAHHAGEFERPPSQAAVMICGQVRRIDLGRVADFGKGGRDPAAARRVSALPSE